MVSLHQLRHTLRHQPLQGHSQRDHSSTLHSHRRSLAVLLKPAVLVMSISRSSRQVLVCKGVSRSREGCLMGKRWRVAVKRTKRRREG
jgi:hypothetical protein